MESKSSHAVHNKHTRYLNAWINSIHFGVHIILCCLWTLSLSPPSIVYFVTLQSIRFTIRADAKRRQIKRIWGGVYRLLTARSRIQYLYVPNNSMVFSCIPFHSSKAAAAAAKLHVTQMLPLIRLDCTQHCHKWMSM